MYARDLPLVSACIFGGVGMNPQIQAIAKGVDVLVACPGRLLDLAGQGKVDLAHVEILVLDEADRMLDMGFIHDVKKVLARLPAKRQNLLFSATFSKDITDLADKLLHNPERIEVTPPNTTVERIEQRVYRLPASHKRALLAHLITLGAWEQVLVFTRTKHGANRLAEYLEKHGLTAAAIHGNKSQNARTKALADFKANSVRVLVATDIAARGLDIDQLPHVVNFELPNVEEDYVHRIGRTGRAGRSGEAISMVAPDEEKLLKSIERVTKQKIPDGDLMGFDASQVEAESLKCASASRTAAAAVATSRPAAMAAKTPTAAARTRARTKARPSSRQRTSRPTRKSPATSNSSSASRVTRSRASNSRPATALSRKPLPTVIQRNSWTTISTTSATAPTTSALTRTLKAKAATAVRVVQVKARARAKAQASAATTAVAKAAMLAASSAAAAAVATSAHATPTVVVHVVTTMAVAATARPGVTMPRPRSRQCAAPANSTSP